MRVPASALLAVSIASGGCAAGASVSQIATPASPGLVTGVTVGESLRSAASRCHDTTVVLPHMEPAADLERLLPSSVAGRSLTKWSVSGHGNFWIALGDSCWPDAPSIADLATWDSAIDEWLAPFESPDDSRRIDVANLLLAVAGRSDPAGDPPFFVFGAARPRDDDEIEAAVHVLFAVAGFADPVLAGYLPDYQEQTIGGKLVGVGEAGMLSQSEWMHGRPYLYQTDEHLFIVVTDEDRWAADALGQLPP